MIKLLYGMQDQWHNVSHSKVRRRVLLYWIQEELFSNNCTQITFNSLHIKKVVKKPNSASFVLGQRLVYLPVKLPNHFVIMIRVWLSLKCVNREIYLNGMKKVKANFHMYQQKRPSVLFSSPWHAVLQIIHSE